MLSEMQFFSKFAKDKYKTILLINRNFLAVLVALVLFPATFPLLGQDAASIRLKTVVIDPGHGGKDAGCISPSGKTLEKTVVLDIGKRLADKIRTGCPDVKVIMTRSKDVFVELQGRADIANRNGADLFISIHVNSVEGKRTTPNGYSIHILGQYTSKKKDLYAGNMDVVKRENSVILLEDDYSTRYEGFDPRDPESYIFMNLMQNSHLEQSLLFAQYVEEEMRGGAIASSRGISQDPLYVLWRTAMPAVLVECGFMCNPKDRGALITEEGRDRIASDLYDAFVRYKKGYEVDAGPRPASSPAPAASPAQESSDEAAPSDAVRYGVQVLVSSKQMAKDDPFFRGETFIRIPAGRLFKYVVCVSEDPEDVKKSWKEMKKDFPDSFVVRMENGTVSRMQ